MTLSETLQDHFDTLRDEQGGVVEDHVRTAYESGVQEEVQWLKNYGVQVTETDPSPGDTFETVRDRADNRVEWYENTLEDAVLDALDDSKGDVYELLADVLSDGIEITRRTMPEEWKWVNPNGSAEIEARDVFYTELLPPDRYYAWVTAFAHTEAKHAGRVNVQLGVDDVMGHVWADPLTQETTPMAARLHGETFGRDGLPFYPPITDHGRSRILPLFKADSGPSRRLPSVDDLVDQRERWFINYHRMQKGELPEDDWLDQPIVEGEYSLEFIYRQLFPRDLEQYLPDNARTQNQAGDV